MLDNLQDVFGAVTVGLLALSLVCLYCWLTYRPNLAFWTFCRRPFHRFKKIPSLFFIFVPFIYGFGLIVQDITDNLTDSEYRKVFFISDWQHRVLDSEGNHRLKVLFEDRKATGLWTNISSEMGYISQILYRIYPKNADKVSEFLKSPVEFAKCNKEQARKFVNTIYYEAKNWAYLQKNYFAELESIQRRIDFSRSTFLVSTWGVVLFPLLVIVSFVRLYRQPQNTITKSKLPIKLLKVLSLLVAVSIFGWFGYDRAETNFNERAFGYFFSHLRQSMSTKKHTVDARLQGNLWVQTSGEYEAITRQTFRAAIKATADRVCGIGVSASNCSTPVGQAGWRLSEHNRPYAFVMDLDETILDNAPYQSLLISAGQSHSDELWNDWITHRYDDVGLVPGAREFLRGLKKLRVAPIFISNRLESERHATVKTLVNLGISDGDPMYRLLLKKNSSQKDARRALIENRFEVVGFVGDNLGDFSDEFNQADTFEERLEYVRRYTKNWGSNWFTLPNPVYGKWQAFVGEEPVEKYLSITRSRKIGTH